MVVSLEVSLEVSFIYVVSPECGNHFDGFHLGHMLLVVWFLILFSWCHLSVM